MNVKTLCLGALTMGDATGYEIRKMFEDGPFGQFYDASYGSIYPALNTLLQDRMVSVKEHVQEGKPDKKVYSLTPDGMAHFKAALAEAPAKDKIRSEHVVRLFFADFMTKKDLAAVYASYQGHFEEQIARLKSLESDESKSGRMFARGLGLRFYEQMAAYLIENRASLLDENKPGFEDTNSEPLKLQGSGNV